MAARKPPENRAQSLFALAERQIVGLYDAGVLSPAVLHHVVAGFANSGIDWNEKGTRRTVDDHTVQEAVVFIMMPGRVLRTAQKDFISIVEHLAGKTEHTQDRQESPETDDEALLTQLGGGKKRAANRRSTRNDEPAQKPAGFNPLVGARAVSKR